MPQPDKTTRSLSSDIQIRILLVDDMKTIRTHARALLANGHFDIREAADGEEALALAKAIQPHVVLMDIVMPKMDGITCCRRLKKDHASKNIKVIMVTGKGDYRQIAEAFRAGCDDYITKPINADELREKVNELSRYVIARDLLRPVLEKDSV